MPKKSKKRAGRNAGKSQTRSTAAKRQAAYKKSRPAVWDKKERRANTPITGTFRSTAHGYGFLTPDEAFSEQYPTDLFVPARDTMGAVMLDRVSAIALAANRHSARKGPEAKITEIIEHGLQNVTGTFYFRRTKKKMPPALGFVVPDDGKLPFNISVRGSDSNGAADGDKVLVQLTRYPSHADPTVWGRVERVYGDAESREANYEAILDAHSVRRDFPDEVLQCADKVAAREITAQDRTDLREEMIFTIDGADAKDLDDAISLQTLPDGYLLGVHIADVSAYVTQGDPLDREAYSRGTSIYFADQVVPMLPRALSNGCCSLHAGVDRYALSAFIRLSPRGEITGCEIKESVICSKVRGVYEEINDVIEKQTNSAWYEKYALLFPEHLPQMLNLYRILEQKNKQKGALELDSDEAKIIIGADGTPSDIVLRTRGVSERMIEQFMLCANEAVATMLHTQQQPCIYRVHEEPPQDKLQQFRLFAHGMGLDTRPLQAAHPAPAAMQQILQQAKDYHVSRAVSSILLRTLAKAKYSAQPGFHYGLATAFYCHFTSPIRRYPDLVTHRILKAWLHRDSTQKQTLDRLRAYAPKAALQSSACEQTALDAERDIEDMYKVLFMQTRIGEAFYACITSVTPFGFFADFYHTCEGLVSIHTLGGVWHYDENSCRLVSGNRRFQTGDTVRVRLERADIITRKMDLSLLL